MKYTHPIFGIILGMLFGITAHAETITLKISHFLPSSHPTQTVFLEPWAKKIEEKTQGKVKFEIYSAGSAFGHVASQLDQVRAGAVDIVHGLTGIPRARLPRTSLIDMPFLVKSSDAASHTLWQLYQDGDLAPDYKGLKVLALHAHNAGLIHTRGKQVVTMTDLKGLRIRTPSQAISMMLRTLGATPVGLPPTQVYESLQKGVIDGNVFPYEAIQSFKLHEVLDYHLDAKVYTTSFYFAMNARKFASLPKDIRDAIESVSGQTLVSKFGPWWDKWDQGGLLNIQKKGNPITLLPDSQRHKWRTALTPMIEDYLQSIEKLGVENARDIYAKMQKSIAQQEK